MLARGTSLKSKSFACRDAPVLLRAEKKLSPRWPGSASRKVCRGVQVGEEVGVLDGERVNAQAVEGLGHFVNALGEGSLNRLPAAVVVDGAQGLGAALGVLGEEEVGIPGLGGFEKVGQEGGCQVRHVAGHY